MNVKTLAFLKDFSYAVVSNLVSLLISTLVVLIVPRMIGVEEYGYWQLYLFYTSYVGFLQFGWNDGIYLRYGGSKYEELDKRLFSTQFWLLMISQTLIALIIIGFALLYINDVSRQFILIMVALCLILVGVRAMPLFVLQATNKIKEFAQITIIGRVLYFALICLFLIFGINEYKIMIVGDLIGKLISLLYAMYCCKDIVFRKFTTLTVSFKEVISNVNVGINLMFANIASLLIVGIVRFGIEHSWDVTTFGKVSLTLSISNMMMIFINAVGIVMFPMLRRIDAAKLSKIYETLSPILMMLFLGLLLSYYPIKMILSSWLVAYSDSLIFMVLVFPMFIYEGKMALLINTYLKTLRKEKLMLRINLISLVLSTLLTVLTSLVIKNLTLAILSIVIILAFRTILAEWYLSKLLKISINKDFLLELIVISSFILTGWLGKERNLWFPIMLYFIVYMAYLLLKRKNIVHAIKVLKNITSVRK
ncbi:oligosaccharide flippase family protein [Paenibacillus typhae]|nr:oligosaccharide flippase family protein [Paenibacillus typhae]